ncbi:MAG: hypothetical protein KDA44_02730 [Planctomycetales bacterium]|nr:hypothetical protein [Planctomycetales bacterium]
MTTQLPIVSQARVNERPSSTAVPTGPSTSRGLAWMLAGNLIFAACQWGTQIAISRVGTQTHVGQYAVAIAIGAPVWFLLSLQLRALQASDASGAFRFGDYWRLRLATIPAGLSLIVAAVLIASYRAETAAVVIAYGAAKAIEALSDVCHGAHQRGRRLHVVGLSLAIKGVASISAVAITLWITGSMAWAAASLGGAWLALFWFHDRRRGLEGNATPSFAGWNTDRSWQLVRLGAPLGIGITLLAIIVSLPNLLVESALSEADVGVFSAMTCLTWAGIPLINAVGQSSMCTLGSLWSERNIAELRRLTLRLALLGAALGLAALAAVALFGNWAMTTIYGPAYGGHPAAMLWLTAAAALLYCTRSAADALTAMRCARTHVCIHSAAVIGMVTAGWMLRSTLTLETAAELLAGTLAFRGMTLAVAFLYATRAASSARDLAPVTSPDIAASARRAAA